MTGLTLKERLSERLAEFPLMRTMLLNPWFALAFITMAVLGMSVVACLPKLWMSTPKGFNPQIRVSLLDKMQAWSLRTAAQRKAEAGDHVGAALSWQSALANDPGNLELHREALRHLGEAPELPTGSTSRILRNAGWMFRLGGTNRTDFELLAGAFDKYGMGEEVYGLLSSLADDLGPELQGAYLKALFLVGKYEEFETRWEELTDRLPDDPALALYRTAYLAGWGPPASADASLERLMTAMDDVRDGSLACRLLMAVSRQRLDPDTFGLALQRQHERSQDRIVDHAQYWQLLRATGRKNEARVLVNAFNRPPRSAQDVVAIAEAMAALDLAEPCLDYLRRHAGEFGRANDRWSAAVWAAYADMLIARRDWEGLKDVATEMRSVPGGHEVLTGFSRFLDGRVAFATGAVPAAEAAFDEAVKAGFPLGRVGIRVGINLLQMGYPELALRALRPLESSFGSDTAYWRAVFDAAYAWRQDEVLLLKSASRAHELEPDNREWQFNYAAALLIGNWRLEEALRLTMNLALSNPNSVGAILNHTIALVLNGRGEDAGHWLNKVNFAQLTGPQTVAYHIASAGVNRSRGDWPTVRADLRALDKEVLFPTQRAWLEEIRGAIPDGNDGVARGQE